MAAQLNRWGVPAGLELVRDLMRELGLVACQPRPWRPVTTPPGAAGPIPDLVDRDVSATVPVETMVGDLTDIPTWEGWLYLATVLDCASRKVIGWAMDDHYKTPLITAAIDMASGRSDGVDIRLKPVVPTELIARPLTTPCGLDLDAETRSIEQQRHQLLWYGWYGDCS